MTTEREALDAEVAKVEPVWPMVTARQAEVEFYATSLDAVATEATRLRQGLWDVFRILGGDTDGDQTPAALTSDIVALVVQEARDFREDRETDDRNWEATVDRLHATRTEARAKVAAVAALHYEYRAAHIDAYDICAECSRVEPTYGVPWPCPTAQAMGISA